MLLSDFQDKRVIIWTKTKETSWTPKVLNTFDDVVWHVSWSVTGNVLAVSGGDNKVSIGEIFISEEFIVVYFLCFITDNNSCYLSQFV